MKLFSLMGADRTQEVLKTVGGAVDIATAVFLAICASMIVFFAIWVGFNFAKATDDAKRAQAKSQLIYSIVGLVGITVMITLFTTVLGGYKAPKQINRPDGVTADMDSTLTTANSVLTIINTVVGCVLKILSSAATIFAVYVGWQLMKAEDDAKRKQAKTQLIYTAVGIVAVVAIQSIATAVITALPGYKASGEHNLDNAWVLLPRIR
ncbi:MAG: pilin [Christensenellaceae bacterium]|nr:pilin [Christensenellaceae bacterium]